MPEQISVSEFVAETHEGYKAPKAFSFTTRTAQCRDTVAAIEEVNECCGQETFSGEER
ncbi:arf-GAP with SH3 domain, ANK repeat and PH domain-containing protein 2 isoform X10 [Mus musculus]|nr:arf-GAP with SH3 domain, ANK repeat and PH domain-containing protein 2 isoform X10 [Mus musculus]